jgi:hypothetical protein
MTRKPQGPTRGESDVEIEVSEYEDDERVEYIEAENTVRYVAGWRHTNHEEVRNGEPPDREPVYGTTPFERWATTRCLTAAGRAAVEHISDELRTDEVSSGIAGDIDGKGRAAFVSVENCSGPCRESSRRDVGRVRTTRRSHPLVHPSDLPPR